VAIGMDAAFSEPSHPCPVKPMTTKPNKRSRLRGAIAHYRDVRRSLYTPASPQSRYGLDWMNFFVADVQTGFGAFAFLTKIK